MSVPTIIMFEGKRQTLEQWAAERGPGWSARLIKLRLYRGWSVEDALTKPVQKNYGPDDVCMSEEGCTEKPYCRGLCHNHYKKALYNEDPKRKAWRKKYWANKDPKTIMYASAKHRATRKGIEFNIDLDDIVIPEKCPVLGIPLERNRSDRRGFTDNSPSLDRVDNNKGYVKGNVCVISMRANSCKGNLEPWEIKAVYEYSVKMRPPESEEPPS